VDTNIHIYICKISKKKIKGKEKKGESKKKKKRINRDWAENKIYEGG
jgi:hypothetical protein